MTTASIVAFRGRAQPKGSNRRIGNYGAEPFNLNLLTMRLSSEGERVTGIYPAYSAARPFFQSGQPETSSELDRIAVMSESLHEPGKISFPRRIMRRRGSARLGETLRPPNAKLADTGRSPMEREASIVNIMCQCCQGLRLHWRYVHVRDVLELHVKKSL
jgi:hypothetical protein